MSKSSRQEQKSNGSPHDRNYGRLDDGKLENGLVLENMEFAVVQKLKTSPRMNTDDTDFQIQNASIRPSRSV